MGAGGDAVEQGVQAWQGLRGCEGHRERLSSALARPSTCITQELLLYRCYIHHLDPVTPVAPHATGHPSRSLLVLRLLRASAPGNPYTNLRRDHHDPSRKPLPATRQRSPVLPSPDANSYPDLSAPGPTLSRARPSLLSLVEDFTSTTPLLP